jgi:cellulose synthase/poly-beta-1,6-N-acetylglucosamine synthase-like glycosyltransferase
VCTRHRRDLLARCLPALARLEHPSYELIVVDNSEGEREVEGLAAEVGARYVIESRVGLSRARNTGGRAAGGEIVAYIDDDAVADPGWLSRHASALEDPSLSATTGRILPISLEAPSAQAYAAAGGEDLGAVAFRVDRESRGWFEMANFGGIGVGPNMAFRRALFDSGWGFRETLGPGGGIAGEEHYAFFTLIRDGHAIAYLPEAIVHHDYPATMAAFRRRRSRILRGGVAYLIMLLVEEPEHRHDTWRYLREAARGSRRAWRPVQGQERFAGKGDLVLAVAGGVPLYARTLLTERGIRNAPRPPAPTAELEARRSFSPD